MVWCVEVISSCMVGFRVGNGDDGEYGGGSRSWVVVWSVGWVYQLCGVGRPMCGVRSLVCGVNVQVCGAEGPPCNAHGHFCRFSR